MTSRLDRVVALTDAVAAIAMTLLVLPLVEVSRDIETDRLVAMLQHDGSLLLSFAVSFLVIWVFWAAHGAALARLTETSSERVPHLGVLNVLWLMVLAFLPFPTALVGREPTTSTVPLYVGTMAALSALTSAIVTVTDRAAGASRRAAWTWSTTGVFVLCALLGGASPDLGLAALVLSAVVRALEVRSLRHADPAATVAQPEQVRS